MKLETLKKSEQENCVAQHNFMEAERLENQMNELHSALKELKEEPLTPPQHLEKKTDILTTIKCLDIAAGILLSPQVTSLTMSLKALKQDFINEFLISENDSIRVKAFRCYALCCIIDKESSTNGIHIFSTPVSNQQMRLKNLIQASDDSAKNFSYYITDIKCFHILFWQTTYIFNV